MTRTNFHQLQIFHTVARLGSFSKAAHELSISQPAVSVQVRELEKRIGSTLLHRMNKGLQLTDTGNLVFDYARRIFVLAEEMEGTVQDVQGLRAGRLTIGSSSTPGEYILPWVIGQFQQRYPGIEVSLSISNTQSVLEQLRSRELDLGMAGAPVSLQGLVSFTYVLDEVVLIASPAHPLAAKTAVSLKDIHGQKFILREMGSATRRAGEDCLREHNIPIHVVMQLGSNEAVKSAVAAGLGLGMVSKFAVIPDAAAGFIKVLPVKGWKCQRPLTVFYRDDRHLPSAQRAFLRFLQDERPLPNIQAVMAHPSAVENHSSG